MLRRAVPLGTTAETKGDPPIPFRIILASGIVAALAGCAGSPDEPSAISPDALASQGHDAYNRGEYRNALSYFEEALELDSDNAFALEGVAASKDGIEYFGDRRPVKGDVATERAIYRMSLQGYEAYERGDLSGAAARFDAVLAIAPGDAYALKAMEAVRRRAARRVEGAGEGTAAPPVSPEGRPAGPAPEEGAYVAVGSYDALVSSGTVPGDGLFVDPPVQGPGIPFGTIEPGA